MTLLNETDKSFWHGFIDFYEPFFQSRNINTIAEIGVFKGNSIRYLLNRFQNAQIYGADILTYQSTWPVDDRFKFSSFDQGNLSSLRLFLEQTTFDLIIEDGSHIPEHQVMALYEGIKNLNNNGLYILEDIHTSYKRYNSKKIGSIEFNVKQKGNALTVLLAIMHYREINVKIDYQIATLIAKNSLFNSEQIIFLNENIKHINFYRRNKLPKKCYNCGSHDFDFSSLKCVCGIEIFSDSDSMTFVIEKKS